MLQETVWALSNIQRPLRQVSIIKSEKLLLNLKVSIEKVSIIRS